MTRLSEVAVANECWGSVLGANGWKRFFRLAFQMPQRFADQLAGAFEIRVCSVEIKHSSYGIRSRRQHMNSQAVGFLDKFACGNASQPEANNVRLDRSGIDVNLGV